MRLRKEYLYRKSLEGKAREEYEKKASIRKALEGTLLAHQRHHFHLSVLSVPAVALNVFLGGKMNEPRLV